MGMMGGLGRRLRGWRGEVEQDLRCRFASGWDGMEYSDGAFSFEGEMLWRERKWKSVAFLGCWILAFVAALVDGSVGVLMVVLEVVGDTPGMR